MSSRCWCSFWSLSLYCEYESLACLIDLHLCLYVCMYVQCMLLSIYVCIHGNSCKNFCFCLSYHVLKRGLWIESLPFQLSWLNVEFSGSSSGLVLSGHAAMPNDLSLSAESSHRVAGESHLTQAVPWALKASHGVHPPKQVNTCKTIKNKAHMFIHPPGRGVTGTVVKPGSFVLIFIYVFLCVWMFCLCVYMYITVMWCLQRPERAFGFPLSLLCFLSCDIPPCDVYVVVSRSY